MLLLLHVFLLAIYVTATRSSIELEAELHRHSVSARDVVPDLRILPLGDSITLGERSTDGNGYRLALLNKLSPSYNVAYIGSQASGSMTNNRHEGHSGFSIEYVAVMAPQNYPHHPDVVLLMAGTNNFIFDIDVEDAPQMMSNLIANITGECPDAAVIVGTCPILLRDGKGSLVMEFNEALRGVVGDFAEQGKKVSLGDMKMVGPDMIHQDDLIHPTDEGYRVIAQGWFDAIVESGKAGWIDTPSSHTSWIASGKLGFFLAGSMLLVLAAYALRCIVASRTTYRPIPQSTSRYH